MVQPMPWHFVAASDIHWMLELTAPRVQRTLAYAYRQNELDDATRARATGVMERALSGEQPLTRAELNTHLARAGIMVKGIRLALLTVHAELERVICSGARRDKQSTYTLLEKRAPNPKRLSKEEALAELTTRYFRSHGPATIRDFVWWSGLATTDAKRGLEMCRAEHDVIVGRMYWTTGRPRASGTRRGPVHLLPIYDEYLVAYRDHDAVPRAKASFGILPQALVAAGQVAGAWKAVMRGNELVVDVVTRRQLTGVEPRALAETVRRYGWFIGRAVAINCNLQGK